MDLAMLHRERLEELLIEQCSIMCFDGEWEKTYSSLTVKILDLYGTNYPVKLRSKLALAISIVLKPNSESHFLDAFRLLSDWDFVGGPLWGIQSELLQYKTFDAMKDEIDNSTNQNQEGKRDEVGTASLRKIIDDVLPSDLPSYVHSSKVSVEIKRLRAQFQILVDKRKSDARHDRSSRSCFTSKLTCLQGRNLETCNSRE